MSSYEEDCTKTAEVVARELVRRNVDPNEVASAMTTLRAQEDGHVGPRGLEYSL